MGGSEERDGEKMERAVGQASIEELFDVVIIGSGIAGLASAIMAADAGMSAIILEKSDLVGGGTSGSYGGVWTAMNDQAREHGLHDDRAAARTYLEFVAGGQGDPARMDAFLDAGPRAVTAMLRAGVAFELSRVADHFYGSAYGSLPHGRSLQVAPFSGSRLGAWRSRLRTPPGDTWRIPLSEFLKIPAERREQEIEEARARDDISNGSGLVAYALLAALERGVPIRLGVSAQQLITEGGRVTSVQASDGRRYAASGGVVIATGGFESDEALTAEVENLPGYISEFIPDINGDGLRMGGEVGVAFRIVHNNNAVLLAYRDQETGASMNVANRELVAAHSLVVNRAGKRFGNEASFQDLSISIRKFCGIERRHENLPCWMIFDSQFVEQTGIGHGGPGHVPAWTPSADRIEDLARQVGIDPTGLAATVSAFERMATEGKDTDFRRGERLWTFAPAAGRGPNPSLGAISRPPFYAMPLRPTNAGASGLRADPSARALGWKGAPIAGLYVVGNAAAHDEYGVGYQAGTSLGSAMTFALLAVENIAASLGRIPAPARAPAESPQQQAEPEQAGVVKIGLAASSIGGR